ncbi:MAG: amidohydrolase family protein [Deltaproteobacteria bacterium]|nr:amidohydrolase family protein [Deltaproteobacteria bacterium]
MAEFDTIIKGGTIVDGTLIPPYKADLGIKGGKIAKIGHLKSSEARQVLDATGLIVAPGVIDLHCHYDAPIHWDPSCSIGSWHGVTSVTNGNCGFGFAPVRHKDADRSMWSMERNEAIPYEAMKATMPFTWETFPEWMDHIDRLPKGVNMIQLVPVTPLVSYVMGGWDQAKSRQPNDKEMAEMIQVLDEAMAAGANGWAAQRLTGYGASVQRDYDGTLMVSDIMSDEFYLALAQAMRKYDRGTIQFAQVSGAIDEGIEAPRRDMDFGGQLAAASNRPLIFNAVAAIDERPQVFRTMLSVVDEYNKKGVPLVGHAVTIRANFRFSFTDQWNLFDNVDAWREATLGSAEERKAKLANPKLRQAMREEYDRTKQPKVLGDIADFVCRKISRDELRTKYQDRTVRDIAQAEHKHVIDALLDVSAADDWKTQWLTPVRNQNPEYCKEMLSHRTVAGFSDGGAHTKFQNLGSFPTDLLMWMVRDTGMITLEQAHYHLSYMPAWVAGFKDRGCLREGMAADVLVYDLEKLAIKEPEVVYDVPPNNDSRLVQRPEGYRWIMVNSQVTFADSKETGVYPGKLLRCS